MKLIIQIPCLNEEKTLPIAVCDIPHTISGIDKIETLVIDDGSTDLTSLSALECGVDHIIKLPKTEGLARAFTKGIDACLKLDADIIVNTDADNQYNGKDIPKLIEPILKKRADIVIGTRPIDAIQHFSFIKKKLQKLGSIVVRAVSQTDVPDVTSGFRAFSREAALRINIISEFSYTLETIIQAGKRKISIEHVPISTNEKLRESRLFGSTWSYIKQSASTIIRIYTMYESLKVFGYIGGTIFSLGVVISLRFLYYYITEGSSGHIQSLILASILFMVGFIFIMIGLLSDLISGNRKLIEDVLYRIKLNELSLKNDNKEQ